MIDKAWKMSILPLFITASENALENIEQSSEPPKITNFYIAVENYAHVDNDISVHSALTNAELLNLPLWIKTRKKTKRNNRPIQSQ